MLARKRFFRRMKETREWKLQGNFAMGIHTMKRILEIIDELTLKFENIWVLGNRFPENLKDILVKEVENLNRDRVKLLGFISSNEEISKINITGGNLIDLPSENRSYQEVKEIFAKIM